MERRRVNFTEDVKPLKTDLLCCQIKNNHGEVNLGILSLNHSYMSEIDLQFQSEGSVSVVLANKSTLKVISFNPRVEDSGHHLIIQLDCLVLGKQCETLTFNTSKKSSTLSIKYQVMKADDGKPLLKNGVKLLKIIKNDDDEDKIDNE
ncbi:uncharacterized protein LOC136078344 [Hydra vulgaris]|uniref:Adipose-secreted signaling protein n=1 Tax=Hydra vulgaris TaxID=6087 RepID=A0ABM4BLX5_HYDVU